MIGGTGDEGFGLALRWAKKGHSVFVGSRSLERAQSAAKAIRDSLGGQSNVTGLTNQDAVSKADIIVVTVPFSGLAETLRTIKPSLREGQIVVNVSVPLETSVGGRATRTISVWSGSAGEFARSLLPRNVMVVTAFNNVSAEALTDLGKQVDCDVLVCGDEDAAKLTVRELVNALPGARYIDAGQLGNSRIVEPLTALLVSLNIHYGIKNSGIRITGPVST